MPSARLQRRAGLLAEGLVVVICALAMTWPSAAWYLSWGSNPYVHPTGDALLYAYVMQVEMETLLDPGSRGLWDGRFFHPIDERSLLTTEPTWAITVAAAPLWLWLGDPFFVCRVGAIIAGVLGWLATYALGRHLGFGRMGSLLAALALGVSAAWLTLGARPFFWAMPLVPLLLICLDRIAGERPWRWSLTAGLLLGILAWASCHLTVMGGVAVGAFALWRWARSGFSRRAALPIALGASLAALLAAGCYVPMARTLGAQGFERGLELQATDPSNAAAMITAPWSKLSLGLLGPEGMATATGETIVGLHLVIVALCLLGGIAALWRARSDPGLLRRTVILALAWSALVVAGVLFLPEEIAGRDIDRTATASIYVALGCAAIAGRHRLRSLLTRIEGFFLALALFAAIMACGPLIPIGAEGHIPSPALLFCRLPGFSGIRVSSRWGLLLAFATALAAAALVARLRPRLLAASVGTALIALIAWDCTHPKAWPGFDLEPSTIRWQWRPIDDHLKDLPGPGAVLELPLCSSPEFTMQRVFGCLRHGRPLVNGYAGFVPDTHRRYLLPSDARLQRSGTLDPQSRDALRHLGARYWVIHRTQIRGPEHDWPETLHGLRRIATLDAGATLVYEDPQAE